MDDDDFISKTRRKRQMKELQDVGAALVKLSREQILRLDLPENLREAVLDCKRFTKHEAARRQRQYIGRLMRDIDAGPIAAQLEALQAPSKRQTALFHVAEKWRDALIDDPDAVKRLVIDFPEADPHRLLELAAKARDEKAGERTPKHARELFHALNAMVQDHARKRA